MTSAVLTVNAMRKAEQAAMDAGVSEWELMKRAGEGAAQWIWRVAAGRAVTVLCGPGNNGGDGYVIAEWLRARGLEVQLIAPAEPKTETASKARDTYDGPIASSADGIGAEVLVDAMFGYGLSRRVEGVFAKALSVAAENHPYRIALDVPSGIECDLGGYWGDVPKFDLTLALGAWKRAHFLMPARAKMGVVRLVPIGLKLGDKPVQLSARPGINAPKASDHKYTRGLVAIVAGAMPGASQLAAQAAMRAGAGYVKLLSGTPHANPSADLVADSQPLDSSLSDNRIGAVLVGPGLGRDDAARDKLTRVLETGKPAVLDADALHLLNWDMLEGADASQIILTPHEGELAALCRNFDIEAATKLERAAMLRDLTGLTVLAKGPDTILALGEGGVRFFPNGSSWLSVAGSGDVLAGITASRLAGGLAPNAAAEQAVWLHNEAARFAGPAFTASDLAHGVKPALAHLL